MKKLLLSLGALSAVVAPVAAVVACGSSSTDSALDKVKKFDTTTINNSKLSAADKADAIKAIKGAKSVDALTKVMQDLAPKLGATPVVGNAGNTGDADKTTDPKLASTETVTTLSDTTKVTWPADISDSAKYTGHDYISTAISAKYTDKLIAAWADITSVTGLKSVAEKVIAATYGKSNKYIEENITKWVNRIEGKVALAAPKPVAGGQTHTAQATTSTPIQKLEDVNKLIKAIIDGQVSKNTSTDKDVQVKLFTASDGAAYKTTAKTGTDIQRRLFSFGWKPSASDQRVIDLKDKIIIAYQDDSINPKATDAASRTEWKFSFLSTEGINEFFTNFATGTVSHIDFSKVKTLIEGFLASKA